MHAPRLLSVFILLLGITACQSSAGPADTAADWGHYLGDPATSQYSALDRIDTANVHQLVPAWTYASGDADSSGRSQIQCNPLIVDGVLYGTNPQLKAFAIDAATGTERWTFNPAVFSESLFGMGTNRGLSYWTDGEQARIYYPAGPYLYALDATNGEPIRDFGQGGRLDLHTGLGEAAREQFVISTSPGIIYEDLIIMGGRVSEGMGAAPGNLRAFDIYTGELVWMFSTLTGGMKGGANAWAGMSLDHERGIVYAPTGSASYDFYGGDRPDDNLYANSILALDARTGERIWHYQTVHHDLWDRDHPAPPVLLTVNHRGEERDAVAQVTKSGYTFVLDRDTGEPLFPVEERPVPASELSGEYSSPTQPFPVAPPPFTRQHLSADDLYPFDSSENVAARRRYAELAYTGPYTPPSERGSLIFPGFDGGANWGGPAYSPTDRLLFVSAKEVPCVIQMNPVADIDGADPGQAVYAIGCQACHGNDLRGGGHFGSPSLLGLADRLTPSEVKRTIYEGKGVMPAMNWLDDEQVAAVTEWLLGLPPDPGPEDLKGNSSGKRRDGQNVSDEWPYPYIMDGYTRLKTAAGYPQSAPPWGTLTAIDLDGGTIRWQIPLGEYPDLVERGIRNTGSENYGGPVATAGGLVFIAATLDEKIRAFRSRDGKLLWEAPLPAAGYATPAVYEAAGKQHVVIACGGGKLGTPSGDRYVAFTLPAR